MTLLKYAPGYSNKILDEKSGKEHCKTNTQIHKYINMHQVHRNQIKTKKSQKSNLFTTKQEIDNCRKNLKDAQVSFLSSRGFLLFL